MAGSCKLNVTWGMHTAISEILIRREKFSPLLAAYVYTKLQTGWHIHCCYRRVNSLCQNVLRSHCSNTINIFLLVMLRLRCCQFNTGSLALGLYLLFTNFFFPPQFSICSLGYGWWWLWFEFHLVSFMPF